MFFEDTVEVSDALKSAFKGDLRDGKARMCQKRDRIVNAKKIQIVAEGSREKTVKRLGKIAIIVSEMCSNLLQRQRSFEVHLDVFDDLGHQRATASIFGNKLHALEVFRAEGIETGFDHHNIVGLVGYQIFKKKAMNRVVATKPKVLARPVPHPFLEFMDEILGENADPQL